MEYLSETLTGIARSAILSTLSKIQRGRLNVVIKDGSESKTVSFGESLDAKPLEATLVVLDKTVWLRLCLNLDITFAEAYMLQQIECPDLLNLFLIYVRNWDAFGQNSYLMNFAPSIFRNVLKSTNDPTNALKNASFHYDTSNDMFQAFLSPDMNYSSAIWSGDANETLQSAQLRKIYNIIEKAKIEKGHHILDIGCGWGSLSIEAVRSTGCRVTAITLSKEQKQLFEERIREAGFEKNIEVLLCDYRKAPRPEGGYDRIVSIEMLEHVGYEHMEEYFATISRLLNPTNGRMVVQGITIMEKLHAFQKNADNFITRYIFPGGYLPSINRLLSCIHTGSKASLEVETVQSIGPHYSRTLRIWRKNFEANWENIKASLLASKGTMTQIELEAFKRRWTFYFAYCESGFREGILGDHVVSAVRKPSEFPSDVPI